MDKYISRILIIEKGEPYKKGERIYLNLKHNIIGRSSNKDKADISFDSPYISRRHAVITLNHSFTITDLGSKHGTVVNGIEIRPNKPYTVNDSDRSNLAQGMVVMTYKEGEDFDDRTITLTGILPETGDLFSINLDKREVKVGGALLNFSGKEKDLLLFLYQNKNKALSYNEIKTWLWPERIINNGAVPDVGNDEVNALVYRLRKRLGAYGKLIVTVSRYGVMLEMD